ncbi:unnamed protein product [Lactuca saligna]|uniref:Uncharacterized protein n=1 Tax=Lactuca saligna TaxID=75948 RepID=A0AA35YC20_LACSI|nr:unnamed protein product [Lactuca saligna]
MERMFTQKRKGLKWNLEICPSIRRKIEDMKKIQRFWGVIPSSFHQYGSRWLDEVYAVDLHKRTCGCRSWYNVKPINGHEMWPSNDMNTILPPKRRRMPGRPKINRKKCISERSDRHNEEVGGDSEKEVGGDSEVEVEQVVDEEVVNPGNHHVVAPSLKRRKCGPS